MKKNKKKIISTGILATIVASLLVGIKPTIALANEEVSDKAIRDKLLQRLEQKVDKNDFFSNVKKLQSDNGNSSLSKEGNPEEKVRVIVELEEKPATLQVEQGKQPEKYLIEEVKERQKDIKEEVENQIGEEVRHSYGNLINGFSLDVKRKDVEKIEELDGVKRVSEATVYYPDMTAAKEPIQAIDTWEEYGYKGEGLVVSIIDTGIDYTHKDMKLTDSKKAKISKEDINEEFGKYFTDKIPYGYNFADDNDDIIDKTGSMHGMHVAGTVAANASKEEVENNSGIQGVAPEAQLLAMKVFSNNSNYPGAYSDDIIAAIEKSVELDADVINMSLGAPAGFREDMNPEQIAIKNATDDGVVCVVSAGNETTSTSPYIIDGISDVGVISSPSTAKDALQVASSENSVVILPALTAIINEENVNIGYTNCDVDPLDVFQKDEKLEVVAAGLGRPEDFSNINVQGKIALVKRGENSFVEKQINAQEAGAVAVIIYNNEETTEYINMASDTSVKIPALFINGVDGKKIKDKSNIIFAGEIVSNKNDLSGGMSDFTSWGPTPDLEFAPQITGPGGNIYSTLNNNRYGSKSGTSMAAPNVAGATALIIQGLKESGLNLKDRELVEFVKKTITNTAKPLSEINPLGEEVLYSPRRQGAGIIQTKNAIENRVIATDTNNESTISLKEIDETTEFEVKLKNYSDKDKVYKVEALGEVLTAFEASMENVSIIESMHFDTVLKGASLEFDKDRVTVPANGEVKVKFTLNIEENSVSNNFVEGFIQFKSEDENVASLVVPYMGYYGEWAEETIVDGLVWEPENVNMIGSFAASEMLGEFNYLGFLGQDVDGGVIIDSEKIAISPNEDEVYDSIVPALYLLRNAEEVQVDLLDKDKNIIQENINGDSYLRKKILSTEDGSFQEIYSCLAWDGKIYNKETGEFEVAKEGQYYLNIRSRVASEEEFQDFIMPVKVDLTPIKSTLESAKESQDINYELKLSFNEELKNNNILSFMLYVNGNLIEEYEVNQDIITSNLELNEDSINEVQVATIDNAGNLSIDVYEISVGDYKAEVELIDFPVGGMLNTNELLVQGTYVGDVEEILINGEEPEVMEDGLFSKVVNLKEGYSSVKIVAKSSNGEVIFDNSYKLLVDTIAPEINIFEPTVTEDNKLVTSKDVINLKGEVKDNTIGYELFVNGESILNVSVDGAKTPEETLRKFEKEIPVKNGEFISIKAVDLLGNETTKKYEVVIDREAPEIVINNVKDNSYYNSAIKPSIESSPNIEKVSATLNGKPYNFEEIKEDGEYELEIIAIGLNGVEVKKTINFIIDTIAPEIEVSGIEENKYYNNIVAPKVTVKEESTIVYELNGKYYNGENIVDEGNYTLKVIATDKAGNKAIKEYKFTIDKTPPKVEISGVVDGMKYDKEVTPKFTVSNEDKFTVTVNDKEYDGQPIKDNGKYTVKVVAKDLAGNITEVSKAFTIELPKEANSKPDPTPKPCNTTNKLQEKEGEKQSDNKNDAEITTINKESDNSNNKNNQKSLPDTGGESHYYLGALALLLIAIGFGLRKRKKIS